MSNLISTVIVAAIQASAIQCYRESEFSAHILQLTQKAKAQGAEIVVFPEDINLWLAFVKEHPEVTLDREKRSGVSIGAMSHSPKKSRVRVYFENVTDWILKHLHMPWLGDWLSKPKVARVCSRAFSRAAKEYSVVIVGGAYFHHDKDGLNAVCRVYDKDGSDVGGVEKHHLIPTETALGIVSGALAEPIQTREFRIGVAICYDINSADVCAHLAAGGAQILCVPTSGIRPFPGYPFNPTIDMPQIERAKETGLAVARSYQCGWLFPGMYFDGHASIVGPNGDIKAISRSPTHEQIVVAEVRLN